MIHVVTLDNQHLYPQQLDQMFRMRHAFYVEGHKWADLTSVDGREVDEFDHEAAVYLLSLDPWGGVAAGVRLNPTTRPTLLGKFASWADQPLPVGPDVWDISRWIAAPEHRRGDRQKWSSNHQRELMLGILEFGLARGVSRFSLLAELRLADRIASYGWPIRQLGQPRAYEGGKGIAVAAEIRAGLDVLLLTRSKTGLSAPVLFEAKPPAVPFGPVPASQDLAALVREIGPPLVRRLLQAVAAEIGATYGADTPRIRELLAALMKLLDAAGVRVDLEDGEESPIASHAPATTTYATDAPLPRPA